MRATRAGGCHAEGASLPNEEGGSSRGTHAWEALEKLAKGEGWPRSASYINKKYEELKGEHKDYPDRLATLDFGYSKVQESLKAEL